MAHSKSAWLVLKVGGVWRRGPNTLAGAVPKNAEEGGVGRSVGPFPFSEPGAWTGRG